MTSTPDRDIPVEREIDERTLRRAQRGHVDACRALVLTYERPVFALLSRMLGPGRGALVEELAQETFVHVFRALARFAPLGPARLSTWILTIASRRAADALRKTRPAAEPLADAAAPADATTGDTPADARTNVEHSEGPGEAEPAMWEAAEPPGGFADRVLAAWRRRDPAGGEAGGSERREHVPPRSRWQRFGTSRPALIASAVVVVVCLGVLIAGLRQAADIPAAGPAVIPAAVPADTGRARPEQQAMDPAPAPDISRDALLARDQAQREQIAGLRAENARLRAEIATLLLEPGCGNPDDFAAGEPWFDPGPETLQRFTRNCRVHYDVPPVGDMRPLQLTEETAGRFGLSAHELAPMNQALARIHARWREAVRALYIEATGDSAGADTLSPMAMAREIEDRSMPGEGPRIHERIAWERAGRVAPPADPGQASSLERYFRMLGTVGDELEGMLAERLGPARARQIREHNNGWGRHVAFSGCPDPEASADGPE